MSESKRGSTQPESYQPPQVEDVATVDGPAVTAAGESKPPPGPEWRPQPRDEE